MEKSETIRKTEKPKNLKTVFLFFCFSVFWLPLNAQVQQTKEPITVNGDSVEFSTDNKVVTATGNVSITYKGAKLTCEKLTINMDTKDAQASGHARLENSKGIIEGEKITYNFENKTGMIIDAKFKSNLFFGKSENLEKVSDAEFVAHKGYMSTCNYDYPHYRFKASKMDFFPGDKTTIRDVSVSLGQKKQIPVFYFPGLTQKFQDRSMHVQVTPGKKKDWGPFLLSSWKYHLTDNIDGRIYLDYRRKLGLAEGLGLNYTTPHFGSGNYKFYYTRETPVNLPKGVPNTYTRYFMRWRHKWEIDTQTNIISELYKVTDDKRKFLDPKSNVLKDYFPREYNQDSRPLSYALFHRNFQHSSLDFLMQDRVNHWYDELNKLPEIKYSLPSLQIGETPVYFENSSVFSNLNKKAVTAPASPQEVSSTRFDTTNKFSLPAKVSFISFAPFVANRETFYDEDANGLSIPPRTIFYTGADLSTKFYRIFNVKSNFFGLDLNGLRHIITPTAGFAYNHTPTISNSRLKQIDGVDSITANNSVALGLYNKLQTKRKEQRVDLVDFRIDTRYDFKTGDGNKRKGDLSDFNLYLDVLPYSWMRLHNDSIYSRKQGYFTNVNSDLNFDFGKEHSIGLGHRYQRRNGKELTFSTGWRLTPKWKFGFLGVYEFADYLSDPSVPRIRKGIREEQYTITRDLHCWIMEMSYTKEKGKGETIWLVFRIKEFPGMGFNINKTYNAPKPGSQVNP